MKWIFPCDKSIWYQLEFPNKAKLNEYSTDFRQDASSEMLDFVAEDGRNELIFLMDLFYSLSKYIFINIMNIIFYNNMYIKQYIIDFSPSIRRNVDDDTQKN